MAKPSPLLQKHRQEINEAVAQAKRMTRGLCQDVACKAAHDVFGIGPKRILEFMEVYTRIIREVDALLAEDRKEDRDMVYSKEKWDEEMRKIYELPGEGHWMPPFDERMGIRLLTPKEMREPLPVSEKQGEIYARKKGQKDES